MKSVITVILLLSFTTVIGQELQTTLYFRDGTTLDGYGYISKQDKIKFRFEDQEKYDVWTSLMVKEVEFFFYRGSHTYRYVHLNSKSRYSLLRVLADGDYMLYGKLKNTFEHTPAGNIDSRMVIAKYAGKAISKYYLKKKGETRFTLIPKLGMRKKMRSIFSDCEDFTARYDDGEFKKNTLLEIVEYYNYWCVE